MTEMRYADYSQLLHDEYLKFDYLDTVQAQKVIFQIEEVAQKTGSMEWQLRAERMALELFAKKHILDGAEPSFYQEIINAAQALLARAAKAKLPQMELEFRYMIINYYWHHLKNYESAFACCATQAEQLHHIPTQELPEKALYYAQMADAYYMFKDWPKAILFYSKILDEPETPRNQPAQQRARNGMGLCYRYGYNDLERSDSCFYAMTLISYLRPQEASNRNIWDGIAEGNIGHNLLLRGVYNQAIPLLKSSMEKVLQFDDYAYASGPAIDLADCYLKQGHIPEVKHYINIANNYDTKMPREGRRSRIYEVTSRYYAATGAVHLSMAYMDSMLLANRLYEEQFNAKLLLRLEQKESAQRQVALDRERERRQQVQLRLMMLSVAFVTILGLLGIVTLLYRSKRTAYRNLVRKSQEWAHRNPNHSPQSPPNETDLLVMKEVERFIINMEKYKDDKLSIDSLAQMMHLPRHHLSGVINRCTGKGFSTYINEVRIKEAVRLMSAHPQKCSIEEIAFEVGFYERRTFYNAFKKITGLSPSEFRSNVVVKF